MNGPRSPTLLVCLMAFFILVAFLLAVTLVVTAGPVSDRYDNNPMSLSILNDNTPASASQCMETNAMSVQETCPTSNDDNIFGIINYSGD